jgi:hypothetical protein
LAQKDVNAKDFQAKVKDGQLVIDSPTIKLLESESASDPLDPGIANVLFDRTVGKTVIEVYAPTEVHVSDNPGAIGIFH